MSEDWGTQLVSATQRHLAELGVEKHQHWAIIEELALGPDGKVLGVAISGDDVAAVVLRYCTVPDDWSVNSSVGIVPLIRGGQDDESFSLVNPVTRQPFSASDVFAGKALVLFSVFEVFVAMCSNERFEQTIRENNLPMPAVGSAASKRRALLATFETSMDLNGLPACYMVHLRILTASDFCLPIG